MRRRRKRRRRRRRRRIRRRRRRRRRSKAIFGGLSTQTQKTATHQSTYRHGPRQARHVQSINKIRMTLASTTPLG